MTQAGESSLWSVGQPAHLWTGPRVCRPSNGTLDHEGSGASSLPVSHGQGRVVSHFPSGRCLEAARRLWVCFALLRLSVELTLETRRVGSVP